MSNSESKREPVQMCFSQLLSMVFEMTKRTASMISMGACAPNCKAKALTHLWICTDLCKYEDMRRDTLERTGTNLPYNSMNSVSYIFTTTTGLDVAFNQRYIGKYFVTNENRIHIESNHYVHFHRPVLVRRHRQRCSPFGKRYRERYLSILQCTHYGANVFKYPSK